MSAPGKLQMISAINSAWADQPEIRSYCLAILDHVDGSTRSYITLSMLKKAIGLAPSDAPREFAAAVQYLLGDSAPALELKFEIVDPSGSPVPITGEEAMAATREKINPLTGDIQENVADLISTYLIPSKFLRG
jgi:hypothetical protein